MGRGSPLIFYIFCVINISLQWGKQKPEMIYILCRKGVPKRRIGVVWYNLSKLILGTKYIMVHFYIMVYANAHFIQCTKEITPSPSHYCLYHQLSEISSPFEQQILADIHRTFPDQEVSVTENFQKVYSTVYANLCLLKLYYFRHYLIY